MGKSAVRASRWGPPEVPKEPTDGLRWYEMLFCCCKCRAACKSCVCTTVIYFVPIIVLIALATCNITFGVLWWEKCSYQPWVPRWMVVSAVTPFLLLPFIKAVKESYHGLTCWRAISLTLYLAYLAWIIIGSIWNFDAYRFSTSDTCNNVLVTYALVLTCVHWLFFLLATIPQVYLLTLICCCCEENAIRPLKDDVIDVGDDAEKVL
ncbi:hypothetical protein MAR_010045 [Mya arenaria]|uniref:Uncharacterized protein n=1 Tax=Mya arenaria TaxID=6604 RepID=A0ABY7E0F8_MYAAR|nr:uncharacterized protein LOC128230160 [Mya arenaria]XP_052798165.1 uncharacterized protein LOC128230160 [Mya arenaria]WAR03487.1 hypothetical protein MAR_010045 [Mya arenaria]